LTWAELLLNGAFAVSKQMPEFVRVQMQLSMVAILYAVASRFAKFMGNNIFENFVASKEEQVRREQGKRRRTTNGKQRK